MNTKRTGFLVLLMLAVAVAMGFPGAARAQIRDTGAMVVRVVDPDGAVLAGVLVTAEGPLGTRTEVTGINGTTRFPGLAPGTYTATLTLNGFQEVKRENLRISVGRNVQIVVAMGLASIQETITIIGESPIIDVRSSNVGSVYSEDFIDIMMRRDLSRLKLTISRAAS